MPTNIEPAPAMMTIDFTRHEVVTPNWHAEFVDCSTSDVQCLEVPGRFVMSFPKSCSLAAGWIAAGTRFRVLAPMVHYGLPSGGYMSEAYPHIHFIYQRGSGFVNWIRTVRTPHDPEWNSGSADRVEEYQIRYVGMTAPFPCR